MTRSSPGKDATVRLTLERLIRESGDDFASLSRLLGRNAAYMQQFIKRGVPRRLAEEDRRKLAAHFGVSEEVLGAPSRSGQRLHQERLPETPEDDFVLVPAFDVRAAAGAGAMNDAELAGPPMAFQARWVRSMARGSVDDLSVIRVDGDSMVPTLSDGDRILVDSADRDRLRDGIYVLRVDDVLMVKRLSLNPMRQMLSIRSDNPAYPSWEDCRPDTVDIVGRVIWVGRKLD
jgi:phage repressor protein C with HTH and peptisase S24 domain